MSSSNLTEDVSSLTTKNDELLLYIFELIDDTVNVISLHQFELDQQHQKQLITSEDLKSDSLYFFLLEIDSQESVDVIIKKVNENKDVIIRSHFELNTRKIKAVLGDEDVISARKLGNKNIEFSETGFHVFDKYTYHITITTF